MNEYTEIDLHLIELRFKETRIARDRRRKQLLQSIATEGLQSPVEAVREEDRFILVDGYMRFDIVQRLGQDTIAVYIRQESVLEALLHYLRAGQAKRLDAIEEGWLIEHLVHQSLSYRDIGRQIGKNKGWVQRRHRLVTDLPEPLQEAVRQSHITSWSAERVLTPLSRANAQHAEQLLDAQKNSPLTSRELMAWFKQYQKSNQGQRAAMVEQPKLLLKTLQQRDQTAQSDALKQGVDGQWLEQIQRISQQLRRLTKKVCDVLGPTQSQAQRALLLDAFTELTQQFHQLTQRINEVTHAGQPHQGDHQEPARQGGTDSTDQQTAASIEKHRTPSTERASASKRTDPEVAEHHIQALRSLFED